MIGRASLFVVVVRHRLVLHVLCFVSLVTDHDGYLLSSARHAAEGGLQCSALFAARQVACEHTQLNIYTNLLYEDLNCISGLYVI